MARTALKQSLSPLQALEENKYKSERYQYPENIESLAHAVIFYINVHNNSKTLQQEAAAENTNVLTSSTSNVLREKTGGIQGAEVKLPVVGKIGTLRKTTRILTNIALYVPETLVFDYAQSYATPSLTEYAESAISKALGMFSERLAKTVSGVIQTTKTLAPLTGYAVNPAIEVLYSAPTLREFQFDFNFAPRSETEANQVMEIIRQFRLHQAPEVSEHSYGMFFVPPSEFDIQFQMNENGSFKENPNIPRISTCVLKAINVNYSPNNQFVTFTDGVPVQIQMRLQFTEIDMITRDRVELGF